MVGKIPIWSHLDAIEWKIRFLERIGVYTEQRKISWNAIDQLEDLWEQSEEIHKFWELNTIFKKFRDLNENSRKDIIRMIEKRRGLNYEDL